MKLAGLKIEATEGEAGGIFNQDDIMKNIGHRQNAMRRKSSVIRPDNDPEPSPKASSVMLYSDDTAGCPKFEDYKIVRLIGRGTFGKVFLV